MKKRMLVISMVMFMIAASFSGCGKSTNNGGAHEDSNGQSGKSATEDGTRESVSEQSETADEAFAYGTAEGTQAWEAGEYDTYENEEYGEFRESGFLSTKGSPLSTFAADVDTASYSNLRRMIYDGYRVSDIPKDAVRIEEMLNYFSYDYNRPEKGEPFGITAEISKCPWNEEHELLMLGLQTMPIDFSETRPSNLVFLLDVSGSMYDDDKLPLLQQSFSILTQNLTRKDRVSIVTYAGSDQIILQGVRGNDKETILEAINSLTAGGSTAGSAGIKTAYELAEEFFIEDGINRVILATDGDLNVGLTTERELEELITRKKESGVFLSVLGFGTGNIKDNKMELLADKGNGQYAYIDSVREARKVLVEEMGATLVTVAKDVKFQVEFNPEVVEGYRLIGYENRAMANRDFADDSKDGGEVGAGHSVTVMYEIIRTDGVSGKSIEKNNTWLTLHVRYKEPEGAESKLNSYPIGNASYAANPLEDWKFASAVVQLGLVLRDSEYKGAASLNRVISTLQKLSLRDDEYKSELYDLVRILNEEDR